VDNSSLEFIRTALEGDIMTLAMVLGVIVILIMIGRQPLTRLIFYTFRGAFYLITAAMVIYVFRHYPNDVLFHARRLWTDFHDILGL